MSNEIQTEIYEPATPERPVEIANLATYREWHAESLADPQTFWSKRVESYTWGKKPNQVLSGEGPDARWFADGEINIAENALDRHVEAGRGDLPALIWESEAVDAARRPEEVRTLSFRELRDDVARVAGVLAGFGVKAGDRVTVCLPIVPELVIAMLAIARLGAVHNVIFAGFPPQALRDRIVDSGSEVVITSDGGWRAGKAIALKSTLDHALAATTPVRKVLVLRRTGGPVDWVHGRDHWWHEAQASAKPAAPVRVPGDAPLFIMYTSGSTGKPKGIVHGTAGYLVYAAESGRHGFDLRAGDIFWCTADPAWITGHTYSVYSPLLNGAATVLFEGVLAHPDWDRAWDIVERHRPRALYTTPTLVRGWQRQGEAGPRRRDLGSLRLLGSVGEPIQPSLWRWFREVVGGGRTPIVDTWWQTEAGAATVLPLPYSIPAKPGAAAVPYFGVAPVLLDGAGLEIDGEGTGLLALARPWPGQALGIWGDRARYLSTYWTNGYKHYLTGDVAHRDAEGYLWIRGRADDVIKVNGHRLGTAEIEGALAASPLVAESAVIGIPDEQAGEAIVAFVVPRPRVADDAALRSALVGEVETRVGKLARPRTFHVLPQLPKNRSGKILRRVLKEFAITGKISGDLSTLDDSGALEALLNTHTRKTT